ncbi:MAG: sulfatase-like hydrolase/transferase [Bacilli bacterium]|nr:sulfatase-like hydrolase/transferase [Bacilli bacterium]
MKKLKKYFTKEKMITFLTKLKNIIRNIIPKTINIILLALPFFIIDLITRILGLEIGFFKLGHIAPNLFNISWITLFVGLTISFKKKIGKYIYLTSSLLFITIFLINNVYYSMTKTFFDFNLLESTSEGTPYIIDAIKNCNIIVYISLIFIIYITSKSYKLIPYKTKNNYRTLVYTIILFIIIHSIAPITLGKANQELSWSTWSNPKNIYLSFNDNNKSIQVAGLYEYTFRNYYITFLKTKAEEDAEDVEFLNQAYAEKKKTNNKYTGIFKDKNLILIQLEGIDNWLITKEHTPTLYKLLNTGINFNNHYSYYNGGGSTFNSEFAVNTGFITPLSYTQNAYTFNKNNFPNSLANLFKKENYTVNAFHMNTGEYYSRTTNYKNWGYDNYYGLIDIKKYEDTSYQLDRELILNETFSELLFPEDKKFVDYIITYSTHLPFTNTKGVCKQLYNLDNPDIEEIIEMTEEECAHRQAKETDYMIELLLNKLKEKNILKDTVIVAFTDHYLYTLEDKNILKKYKETKNNLINKTPFFIWQEDIKKTTIKEVTSQLNILPTILNMYGIDYNPNNYIGEDALNPKYKGIVFFSDYSWYDGNVYVEDGYVTNKKKISQTKLEEKNYYITYITEKNDLTLKFNYFKK